jgi:hypothetical protein
MSEVNPLLRSERKRRKVTWDLLDASSLDPKKRRTVGATWRERMKQEHLAVGAFAIVAQELAADGCEPVVLELVTRAASDEVRHTEICRRVALALLGASEVPMRFRGLPNLPGHDDAPLHERVLLHMVEMCCLSETLTGVFFTEMHARATNPAARAAIESLLEDEIDHGKVGWAYLTTRARAKQLAGLAARLPTMMERTVGRAIRDAARHPEGDDPEMEAFGYVGRTTSLSIFRRALTDVMVPGFETLGVDLGPSRECIEELTSLSKKG